MIKSTILIGLLFSVAAIASESLSYSGRLVNADGSPVTGPVDLRFELAYALTPGTIICYHEIDDVVLTNGVFHSKIEFAPSECTTPLSTVLLNATPTNSPVIRVIDQTATPDKAYSFQALHAMPFALVASMAKTLAPLAPADTGKVLQWNGTAWVSATLGSGSGSVNNISTGTGLTGGPITTTGTISIANGGVGTTQLADGAVTDIKITGPISRSKIATGTASHVVVNDGIGALSSVATIPLTQGGTGAANATDARTNLGLGAAAVLGVGYTGTNLMPGAGVPTCLSGAKLHFTGAGPTWWSCIAEDGNDNSKLPLGGGTMVGAIEMSGFKVTGLPTPTDGDDAANKDYVDNQISTESLWDEAGGNVSRSTGNVGIGIASPATLLDIASASLTNGNHDLVRAGTGTSSVRLGYLANGTAATAAFVRSDNSLPLTLATTSTIGTGGGITILNSGFVGVGTNAPTSVLDVTGGNFTISNNANVALGLVFAPSDPSSGFTNTANERRFQWMTTGLPDGTFGYKFAWRNADGSTRKDVLHFHKEGNISIGTSTTGAALHIRAGGSTPTSAPLKFTAGSVLSAPEAGAVEFDGTSLYYTDSTNTRRALATSTGAASFQPSSGSSGAPSYSFAGDTNTGFFSSGADQIGIAANGAQIFNIGASGIVSSTAGGSAISSAAGTAAAPTYAFSGDADTGWYAPLTDTLAAATAGVERIRIGSTGNIGIGTTNPGVKLEVAGAIQSIVSNNLIKVEATDGLAGYGTRLRYGGSGTNTSVFQIQGVADVPKLTIDATGNVGIGTASPNAKLDVTGTSMVTRSTTLAEQNIELNPNDANNTLAIRGNSKENTKKTIRFDSVHDASGSASGSLGFIFRTGPASAPVEMVRITETGNVGIGTNAPTSKLTVHATDGTLLVGTPGTAASNQVSINLSTITDGATGLNNAATKGWQFYARGNAYTSAGEQNDLGIAFWNGTAWKTSQVIDSLTGNVGMGVGTPTSILHLKAGTATAGTAPLKIASGPVMTTPEAGAIEYDGTNLFYTNNSAVRMTLTGASSSGAMTNISSISNAAGNIALTPNSLTGSVSVGPGAASTSSTTGALVVTGDTGISGLLNVGGSIKTNNTFISPLGTAAAPSYAFAGDSDTGWFSPAANTMAAATAGIERVRIDSVGNVGIGTLPLGALHVQTDSSGLTYIDSYGIRGALIGRRANGSVASPTAVLNSEFIMAFAGRGHNGSTFNTNTSGTIAIVSTENHTPTATGAAIAFSTNPNGSNAGALERMRVNENGYVGIGTQLPSTQLTNNQFNTLDAAGNGISANTINWTNSSNGYTQALYNSSTAANSGVLLVKGAHSGNSPIVSVDSGAAQATAGTGLFRILGNGNVGLGTTAPLFKLTNSSATNFNDEIGTGLAGSNTLVWEHGSDSSYGYAAAIVNSQTSASRDSGLLVKITDTGTTERILTLNSNNLDRFAVTGAGYVGIGTPTPSSILSIDGAVNNTIGMERRAAVSAGTGRILTLSAGGASLGASNQVGGNLTLASGTSTGTGTSEVLFQTASAGASGSADNSATTKMVLSGAGNLGIGTSSPTSPLHVSKIFSANSSLEEYAAFVVSNFSQTSGSSHKAGIRSNTSAIHTSGTLPILWGHQSLVSLNGSGGTTTDSAGLWGRVDVGSGHTVTNTFGLMIEDGAGANGPVNNYGIYVKSMVKGTGSNFSIYAPGTSANHFGGYVGVGTTAPTSHLHVQKGTSAVGFQIQGNGSSSVDHMRWVSSAGVTQGVIDSAGQFGIGTSAPQGALHLISSVVNPLILERTGTLNSAVMYKNSSGTAYAGLNTNGNYAVGYNANLSVTPAIVALSSNFVGINQVTPTDQLHVAGNIRTTGCLYYASSSLGTCASDKKIKKDIKKFDLGLNAILGIKPVTFKYNGLGERVEDGITQLGVIAQDVEKVAPSLVKSLDVTLHKGDKEKTTIKAVDYGAFTFVIINAIKDFYRHWYFDSSEIHKELAEKDKKIADLEMRLQRIESSMRD